MKSQGDETVGERHEEIRRHRPNPAREYELVEFDGRVVGARGNEFRVYREEEGEGEEGNDYEIDETDRDGGGDDGWVERAERELREAYCWVQGLWCRLQVGERNRGIGEDLRCPGFAEGGEDGSLESGEGGEDIVVVGVLVAGFDPDNLAGSQGVVAGISCLDGGAKESGGV